MMLARRLEHLTDTRVAADAYGALAKGFAASKEAGIVQVGERFAGAARRLNLIGNSMKMEGQTTDGKSLDWPKYKGKVVLVDFWATWCRPCLAEMPNLKKVYREYHDRGFDIVGVSVDDDDQALTHYLDEANIPWAIVHDKNHHAEESHPLSEYYGVTRFPTMMLVGKDGKVIAFDTYGEELWAQLAKLIGPPSKAAGGDGAEPKTSQRAGAVRQK
jgi:thiol-disulfide isomerase/thioredoxin